MHTPKFLSENARPKAMNLLLPTEAFDNFRAVKDFPIPGFPTDVLPDLIQKVKELDEREEFEPWLRSILADGASTPHGPAEIVDIFTHHVTSNGRHGMAAFILKGKSFSTVKPVDVAHQIYRLKKIEGLKFAVFAAPGIILDAAKEQFCATCEEIVAPFSYYCLVSLWDDERFFEITNVVRKTVVLNLGVIDIIEASKVVEWAQALNRERQNLGRSAYSERIRAILLACESEPVAQAMSSDLQKFSLGSAHDELAWLDVQEHAVRILNAKRKVLFISSNELIQRPDIVDSARSAQFQIVTVPENLASRIAGITDVAGKPVTAISEFIRQHNASFQFKWVSLNQLTPSELNVWHHNQRILAHVGGIPSSVREIRISETMTSGSFSSETLGLWDPQNGWIVLKRSLLNSLDKYAGTLLHEALHAKYALSDVSRDFEHHLTELCGALAARIIRSQHETLRANS